MAEDDLRCLFHLTEHGWKIGTRSFFRRVQGREIDRPAEALATYELHVYQRSAWSAEERNWRRVWKRDGATEELISDLLARFPQPDEDTHP